ncbi:MAG TPA: ABC transporter permease, partial [Nordella sp.]|nr:ABC transporter permease [Nordella sp.]
MILESLGYRIEPRAEISARDRALAVGVALAASLVLCSFLFLAVGVSPFAAFQSLLQGAFGTWRAATETLVKATPLICTGLATAVAFRARLWNIGAEGQVFAGAMFAFWCQSAIPGTSPWIQLPVIILGAMAGGALYAGLAAVLKTRFRVDEVISTVMLNYIIVYALSLLLLKGPWSEAGGFFEQTAKVDPGAILPILFDKTRLHLGFLLALVAATLVYLMIRRSPVGYEIRAAGSNLRALEVQGTNSRRVIVMVMLISGALAGMMALNPIMGD